MIIRSLVNTLDSLSGRRLKRFLRPPPPPYKADLSEKTFIERLSPLSDGLSKAKQAFATGDDKTARKLVVDHFIERKAPKFFCSSDEIRSLAEGIKKQHPEWADALCELVGNDLNQGLRILARRDAPLADLVSWPPFPPGPGGDVLYCAQPHRFGFLPGLALVNHYGMPTLDLVTALIDGWIQTTDEGDKESYHSALLVTQRDLSLSWAFAFIAGLRRESDDQCDRLLFQILKILHADTEFLAGEIGDSYPNNHLLADGFIGWYCGTLFPEFREAHSFKEYSEEIFLRELQRQFLDDGANFEHSMHYHEMGCEMTVAYVILSRLNGSEPPVEVLAKLRKMLSFQAASTGPDCIPLPIGDTTEDPLFALDTNRGWAPGAMREYYRALFDADNPAAPALDPTVERAHWLLGGKLAPAASAVTDNIPTAYPKGGIYVLDDSLTSARLVFRSGPDEDQTLMAGHTHTDLLNIYVSAQGIPIIVDPGTYTYRFNMGKWPAGSPNWRSYFAGQTSHNGLITENDAFGTMLGDFRNQELSCRVRATRDVDVAGLRWHEFEVTDGMVPTGQRRGVVHASGHYWLVYDLLSEDLKAGYSAMSLQFGDTIQLSTGENRTATATAKDLNCTIALSPGYEEPTLYRGSLDPVGGWISPRYGKIVPAPQLQAKTAPGVARPCGFVLQVNPTSGTGCTIEDCVADDSWIGFRIKDGAATDIVFVRTADGGGVMSAWDVEYDGSLIWLRIVSGNIQACRMSGGDMLRYEGQPVDVRPGNDKPEAMAPAARPR